MAMPCMPGEVNEEEEDRDLVRQGEGDLESGDRRGISTRQFLLSKESPGRVVCLLLHISMRFLPYKGYLDLFDWDPCALLG